MTRAAVVLLIPIALASYVIRTIVLALLGSRAPRAAMTVDAWWGWVPLIVVLVVVTIANPLVGLAAGVAMLVYLSTSHAVGSPFRPRR